MAEVTVEPGEDTAVAEVEPVVDEETEYVEPEVLPDEDEETTEEEDFGDEDFFEFDDDDAGYVSEALLSQFNNPETFDSVEFCGTADIEIRDKELYYDRPVTLQAKITGVEMSYRIVWEASDGDDRGWFTVGNGPEYTFTVTEENVDREYRVVLFAVD